MLCRHGDTKLARGPPKSAEQEEEEEDNNNKCDFIVGKTDEPTFKMSSKVSKQYQNDNQSIEQQIADLDSQLESYSIKEGLKRSKDEDVEFDVGEDKRRDEDEDAETETETVENVKVMVRCRPPSKAFNSPASSSNAISGTKQENCVIVNETDKCVEVEGRQFYFDAVFGPHSNNERVYMKSARQLVEFAFQGYNCTVFLYGQTGTGKTYTHSSISLSSFAHLFTLIRDSNTQTRFLIRASYYELYNEDIRDLLSKSDKPLELRESKVRGVYVKDLSCYLVNNLNELEKLKRQGDKRRAIASTNMNEHSSRSHSIFSLTIETVDNGNKYSNNNDNSNKATQLSAKNQTRATSSRQTNEDGKSPKSATVKMGRLHLIDLAGSERQSKSKSSGTRLKEASRINLSLTCLALVIRALTDKSSSHIPYRNSKLTRLLSGSLGGNSKTLLIACISPLKLNLDETLNTLRFASRTKRIKNKAVINEDPKDALLRKYKEQIEELRLKLKERQSRLKGKPIVSEDEAIESLAQNEQASSLDISKQQSVDDSNDLLQQLRLLKGKIMVGGENLLDKAEMHERLLEATKQELEDKRQEELKLRNEIERKRESMERVAQSKGSLESQVVSLDEKLKRALLLYRKIKEEQRDLKSEHEQLKESLLQTIRATSKEIKYSDCIIDDFIPKKDLELINTHAKYDEDSDEWQIKYIALSGNNVAQTNRMTDTQPSLESSVRSSNKGDNCPSQRRQDPFIRMKAVKNT